MTAVEWLVKQICGKHTEAWHEEIQQALEMEKQQIIKHETLHDAKHLLADSASLRYILFLLDSKIKEHDGMIFCSYNEARQYASDCINDNYSDKAVIGMFCLNPNSKEMLITMVETIGFKGDKKNVNQLQLFK